MSLVRAAARATGPDGREWEIYAYKLRAGRPRPKRRLARVAAALRSLGRDEWTVDAVTYVPHETVYTWTTTTEHKGQVVAQVEGHLARGDVPQHLTHASYCGESRSAR
jgi:hypothetical protein